MIALGCDPDDSRGDHPRTDADASAGPAQEAPAPPRSFGDYRIVREVGRGGMGVVYEAWQVSLGRRVALKVLSHGLGDARRRRRFEREARSAGRLHHTNIVPVFGVGEHEGTPYYVMQFITGVGLDAVLDRSRRAPFRMASTDELSGSTAAWDPTEGHAGDVAGDEPTALVEIPLGGSASDTHRDSAFGFVGPPRDPVRGGGPPGAVAAHDAPAETPAPAEAKDDEAGPDRWKWIARLGVQAASGLEFAHSQGVLHRDVKPSNLMLDERGTVWVTDFGLARWGEYQDLTQSDDVVGTLRYMAPEALDGVYDRSGDVYGLGLTLYELLGRRPAFDERDRARLIRQVSQASPPPLRKLDRRIPIDLATVVHKAIERRPEDRYASAAALEADLQRFLEDRPVLARRASLAERYWRWARRNPTIAILGGLLTAVLVTATAASLVAASRFRSQAEVQRGLAEEREAGRLEARKARDEEAEAHRLADAALGNLKAARDELHQTLYATRSNLAAAAWGGDDYGPYRKLLDLMRPRPGEADLRGWEWRYLRGLDGEERLTVRERGEAFVAVAARPDGTSFATLGLDGTIRVWGLVDGRAGWVVEAPNPRNRPSDLRRGVHALAYSPDGRRIAGPGGDGLVGIYDAATGERLRTLGEGRAAVLSLAWSPDGSRLAAAYATHVVHIWDPETGVELPSLPGGHRSSIAAIAVSPDGRVAATGGLDGLVMIWSYGETPGLHRTLAGHEGDVRAVAFSPEGSRLISGGLDGSIRIWDVATGALLTVIQAHKGGVLSLACPRSGGWIASGGNDDAVRVWDADSGRLIHRFLGHTEGVRTLAIAPDGRSLISASTEGVAKVWEPLSPTRPRTLQTQTMLAPTGGAGALALSPDGQLLASGHLDAFTRIWNAKSGVLLQEFKGFPSSVRSLAFSPDGRLLASAGGDPDAPPALRGAVTIWDVAKARPVQTYTGHDGVVDEVVFLADASLIASAGGDHKIHVWDAETGRLRMTLEGHSDAVRRLALSRDGRTLASGADDDAMKLWDLPSGVLKSTIPLGGDVLALAFSDDGRWLASAVRDGPLQVWNPAAPEFPHTLEGHVRHVTCLGFTPDGRLVSGGLDRSVRVWDVAEKRSLLTLEDHSTPVTALAVGRNGDLVSSAALDHTIKLREAPPAE
ncbi:protein kinase domain-containing protein [Paludisphaera mucosa]|uniref:Protein kinase n=1 Tax=Paludisphaera mucosa TaxID=3030827 RepID=A0ABT6FHS1_9BACT|nr:protein kinase [Paludisphaera mucosa]MDG3006928.1 protein kinase [Paludisphaera mucosa]